MATQAGVGTSDLRDSREAGRSAAGAAAEGLPGEAQRTAIVFATAAHDQTALLAGVCDAVGPDVRITGCSGEGVIHARESRETDYFVAVSVVESSSLRLVPYLIEGYGADSRGAARQLIATLDHLEDVFGLVVFPDGITGNCSDFLATLDDELAETPLIVGGTSGDGMRMERTYQYLDSSAKSEAVSGFVLCGPGRLAWAVSHGCLPVGLERTVTDAAGGWVHEIDGAPAWDVFKEYLDGDPQTLNAEGIIHLCIGQPLGGEDADAYGDYRIVTPMALDEQRGSLFFPSGGLQSGDPIRLTRRDPKAIGESAVACADRVSAEGDQPSMVLQFDCAGRGQALFGSSVSSKIVQPLQERFGSDVPWVGFHSFGEIAPIRGRHHYHNYTVVLCAVYDD